MADLQLVIPAKFRAALLAKGALLASLAALFIWLGLEALGRGHWPGAARFGVAALAAGLALYLGWAASLALLDVVAGHGCDSVVHDHDHLPVLIVHSVDNAGHSRVKKG